jgi:hypothetical protein
MLSFIQGSTTQLSNVLQENNSIDSFLDTLKTITTSQSHLHQALAAWAVAFRVQVPHSPGHQYEVEAARVLSQQSCEEQRFTSQD